MWGIFVQNHILAPSPLTVSKKVQQIIESARPRIHYKAGNFMQTAVLPKLKALLPENTFLDLLAKVFGL
jgi:hypothetical protein